MTREELDIELSKYAKTSSYDETCSLLSYYAEELEQQNAELQARIKELEENEDKLKRQWYTIGSDDNYQALLKSGKLRQ